jgi:N-carbamoylputrescine amidase
MAHVTVAAVQLENRPGRPEATRNATERLVARAAAAGADLVVLPELSACGYVPNDAVWELAEPLDGPAVRHARDLARRHRVHLGTGLVERSGYDLYDTYVVIDPEGAIAGAVRKHDAETACFRPGRGDVAIETALGRLGVSICADNHRIDGFERVRAARVDLLLMPHGWPMPTGAGGAVSEADLEASRWQARRVSLAYAAHLGVPVVFANSVGPLPAMPGLLGWLMRQNRFALGGRSHIVEPCGRVTGPVPDGEDLVVATLDVGLAAADLGPPPQWRGWLQPGSRLVRQVVLPVDGWLGARRYARQRARRARVARVAATGPST